MTTALGRQTQLVFMRATFEVDLAFDEPANRLDHVQSALWRIDATLNISRSLVEWMDTSEEELAGASPLLIQPHGLRPEKHELPLVTGLTEGSIDLALDLTPLLTGAGGFSLLAAFLWSVERYWHLPRKLQLESKLLKQLEGAVDEGDYEKFERVAAQLDRLGRTGRLRHESTGVLGAVKAVVSTEES